MKRSKVLILKCTFDGSLLKDGEASPSIDEIEASLRTVRDRVVIVPVRELLENPEEVRSLAATFLCSRQ